MIKVRNLINIDNAHKQRGAALLSVILLLGLLSVLVTAFTTYITNSATAVAIARDRVMQETLVRSALEFGMGRVLSTPGGIPMKGEDKIRLVSGKAKLVWRAETARLDINQADAEILSSLLVTLDLSKEQADEIARLIVARRSLSPTQPIPKPFRDLSGIKLGPFEHPRELLDIPGMTDAIYVRIEPLITVFGSSNKVDPRLADSALLQALPNISRPILAELQSMAELDDEDAKRRISSLGELARYLDVSRKPVVRFDIEAESSGGHLRRYTIVTVHYPDDDRPYRVLMWRETTGS